MAQPARTTRQLAAKISRMMMDWSEKEVVVALKVGKWYPLIIIGIIVGAIGRQYPCAWPLPKSGRRRSTIADAAGYRVAGRQRIFLSGLQPWEPDENTLGDGQFKKQQRL